MTPKITVSKLRDFLSVREDLLRIISFVFIVLAYKAAYHIQLISRSEQTQRANKYYL